LNYIGKQENKIVKSRVKEIKQKKADKNTVDKFNVKIKNSEFFKIFQRFLFSYCIL